MPEISPKKIITTGNLPKTGLLLVDKPKRLTSFDIVRQVKRRIGPVLVKKGRVGHAGTLDPLATGLLVIAYGSATRLIRFVQDRPKIYRTEVTFGVRSTTEDAEGPFEQVEMPPPNKEALQKALEKELGERVQMPPAYSAKKIGGKRAYDLARKGEEVTLQPAHVVAHRLVLEKWESGPFTCKPDVTAENGIKGEATFAGIGRATILCEVGKGYYIRSLARDLGHHLGGGAYMSALRRLSIGEFSTDVAIDPNILQEDDPSALQTLRESISAPWLALSHLQQVERVSDLVATLLKGQKPDIPQLGDEEQGVLHDEHGPALVVHRINGIWKIDLNLLPIRDELESSSSLK